MRGLLEPIDPATGEMMALRLERAVSSLRRSGTEPASVRRITRVVGQIIRRLRQAQPIGRRHRLGIGDWPISGDDIQAVIAGILADYGAGSASLRDVVTVLGVIKIALDKAVIYARYGRP